MHHSKCLHLTTAETTGSYSRLSWCARLVLQVIDHPWFQQNLPPGMLQCNTMVSPPALQHVMFHVALAVPRLPRARPLLGGHNTAQACS